MRVLSSLPFHGERRLHDHEAWATGVLRMDRSQIVAAELIVVAQVKPSLMNDRMRPGGPFRFGSDETPPFAEAFRRCLDQHHRAAIVTEDEVSVGIEDPGRAGGPRR